MQTRIIKKGDRCYIELPGEFLAVDEAEVFQLKEGYYLLTSKLGKQEKNETSHQQENVGLDNEEKILLKKMLAVRFGERTPPELNKILTQSENDALERLIQKRVITIYTSAKYPNGVYNIVDSAYAALKDMPTKQGQPAQENRKTPENKGSDYTNYIAINAAGYMIIDDSRQAFGFSEAMKRLGKANEVVGIKGFDNKFYVATKKYILKVANMIKEHVKDEIDVPTLAQKCKLEPDGCRAVLKIMTEQGETLEKRKDVFVLI